MWLEKGSRLTVAVNPSAQDLADPLFADFVVNTLAFAHVAPECLCLEVTEGGLMADSERAIDTLARLRSLGIGVSVTIRHRYSSLAYLKRLPVDKLKIDQSYVLHLEDQRDLAIVSSTISLAHDGLRAPRVVAEGVEDEPTLDRQSELDCDYIQGFVISRPLPLPSYETWLDAFGGQVRQAA